MGLKDKHDADNVIRAFLKNQIPDRAGLVREMRELCVHSKQAQRLLQEALEESLRQGGTPAVSMNIAMMYGMVIGVLLERERSKRLIVVSSDLLT